MTLFLNIGPSHTRNEPPPQNQLEPNSSLPHGVLAQKGPTPPSRGLPIKQAEANPRPVSPADFEKESDAKASEEAPVYAAINKTKSKLSMLILTTRTDLINLLFYKFFCKFFLIFSKINVKIIFFFKFALNKLYLQTRLLLVPGNLMLKKKKIYYKFLTAVYFKLFISILINCFRFFALSI